jgi:hypothetical protein
MADRDFEATLGRWFAETPEFADADGFAHRIATRLDRSWILRRSLIGAAGVSGGLIAVGQMLGVHVYERVLDASQASATAVSRGSRTISQLQHLGDLPVSGEVLWMGAALAVLAVVLMATRALEEF